MTRVLFLPLNYGSVVQNGPADAFREAGCNLQVFDYYSIYESNRKRVNLVREQLIRTVRSFKPDLMHMQIQHTSVIGGNTVSKIKQMRPNMIITNWTGDVRTHVPRTYKAVSKASDFNLISSTGQIDMFSREIGKQAKYWQIGYDPRLYYPEKIPRNKFEWDVVFIANHNAKENYPGRAEREHVCKLLQREFGKKFRLHGYGWPKGFQCAGSLDQKILNQVYHNSFCNISVSHFNDLNHYFSDRLLMCMASGRPTISLKFPKWESYFTDMGDIVIADSVADIPNKVRWLLANPERARLIGEAGAAKMAAEHTYFSRINELLEMVGLR
jgi:spore maturation protein CgeB